MCSTFNSDYCSIFRFCSKSAFAKRRREISSRTPLILANPLRRHDGSCSLELKHAQIVVKVLDGKHREAVEEHGLASRLHEPIHRTAIGSIAGRSGRTPCWFGFARPVPPKSLEHNLCTPSWGHPRCKEGRGEGRSWIRAKISVCRRPLPPVALCTRRSRVVEVNATSPKHVVQVRHTYEHAQTRYERRLSRSR